MNDEPPTTIPQPQLVIGEPDWYIRIGRNQRIEILIDDPECGDLVIVLNQVSKTNQRQPDGRYAVNINLNVTQVPAKFLRDDL